MIDHLRLGPAVLIGQSMGANTAMLVAAEHPELVRALVVAEGSPDGPLEHDPQPAVAVLIERWLAGWPVPFPDVEAAHAFFVDQGIEPMAWTAGLRRRGDGLWPAFDARVMVDCIADLASRSYSAVARHPVPNADRLRRARPLQQRTRRRARRPTPSGHPRDRS